MWIFTNLSNHQPLFPLTRRIILETDAAAIAARVSRPKADTTDIVINEQTLLNACELFVGDHRAALPSLCALPSPASDWDATGTLGSPCVSRLGSLAWHPMRGDSLKNRKIAPSSRFGHC